MPRILGLSVALVIALWTAQARAVERAEVEQLLAEPIIGPKLALEEAQAYTEAHVPRIGEVQSVEDWQRRTDRMRQEVLDRVVFRGQAKVWRDAKTKVEWLETIEGGPGYHIRKLRYEALPGLWIPALLYEPAKLAGKVPVMLNVNGHDGNGKAAVYKQIRCIHMAKRGMLALNVEWLGMGQLKGENYVHYRMNQLDLCGTSGLAPFYLAMSRALDLLVSLEHADPARVGVAGLSGGGWQTIFISALDPRVTLSNPVAGYSSFRTRARHLSDLGDSEQTPVDLAVFADYDHLTAMLAPRPALLTYNAQDDCCFKAEHALPPLLEAARPIYRLYAREDKLRAHVNTDPGTHNFERDNREALYRMLADHFYGGSTADFDPREIESDSEVKTAEQLQVELPEDNADFHSLALGLLASVPADAGPEMDQAAALSWQVQSRRRLHDVVRAARFDVAAEKAGEQQREGVRATFWRLRVGDWTVPAVELVPDPASPAAATIVVADEGRTATAEEVQRLLALGGSVLAVDPFYFGESRIAERNFLFPLLLAAVGDRPLGLQASQLTAVARWLHSRQPGSPPRIVALGERSSLFSLVAAGLEHEAIGGVELSGSLGSLKEIVERNGSVDKTPELFCFGLLEHFDIRQLACLVAPRPARFRQPSERARNELAELKAVYSLLGNAFKPLE
ncbi:MAG: acetylxylan esterase [Pirellulales bacterium]